MHCKVVEMKSGDQTTIFATQYLGLLNLTKMKNLLGGFTEELLMAVLRAVFKKMPLFLGLGPMPQFFSPFFHRAMPC